MSASEKDVADMIQQDPSLKKHVSRFLGADSFFSPKTVAGGLAKIHGASTTLKGALISEFNRAHAAHNLCPFGATQFVADETKVFADYLHLGTTRIWKKDGTVDEARWQQLVAFVTKDQDPQKEHVLTKTVLKAYLQHCLEHDPQELDTGRNTDSLMSSQLIQAKAASSAWDEVFDRLTCGWDEDEPWIDLALIRLFFEDSEKAFQKAESQELPIPKPVIGNLKMA